MPPFGTLLDCICDKKGMKHYFVPVTLNLLLDVSISDAVSPMFFIPSSAS